MDKASNLPMALWKANLDLQARLGRLMQEGGQQWLELGTRAVGDSAAQFQADARKLLQAGDWQALASLPFETFWRQAETGLGEGKAAAEAAVQAQERFVAGLGEALREWQRQLAGPGPKPASTQVSPRPRPGRGKRCCRAWTRPSPRCSRPAAGAGRASGWVNRHRPPRRPRRDDWHALEPGGAGAAGGGRDGLAPDEAARRLSSTAPTPCRHRRASPAGAACCASSTIR